MELATCTFGTHLVFPEVDGERVNSVLAEVTREHVACARAVTVGVRHGGVL